MKLKPGQLLELMERVEAQGGAHLPDHCKPDVYKIKVKQPDGSFIVKRVFTSGCEREALFVMPYRLDQQVRVQYGGKTSISSPHPDDIKAMEARGGGFVKACANDDRMDLWPKLQPPEDE